MAQPKGSGSKKAFNAKASSSYSTTKAKGGGGRWFNAGYKEMGKQPRGGTGNHDWRRVVGVLENPAAGSDPVSARFSAIYSSRSELPHPRVYLRFWHTLFFSFWLLKVRSNVWPLVKG